MVAGLTIVSRPTCDAAHWAADMSIAHKSLTLMGINIILFQSLEGEPVLNNPMVLRVFNIDQDVFTM